jgi:hypothetical protein
VAEMINKRKSEGVTAIHDRELRWYDWAAYLDQFYSGKITNISIKQAFKFNPDGTVESKDYSDSTTTISTKLLKPEVTTNDIIRTWNNANEDVFR